MTADGLELNRKSTRSAAKKAIDTLVVPGILRWARDDPHKVVRDLEGITCKPKSLRAESNKPPGLNMASIGANRKCRLSGRNTDFDQLFTTCDSPFTTG
jgi:hypothetical protein